MALRLQNPEELPKRAGLEIKLRGNKKATRHTSEWHSHLQR